MIKRCFTAGSSVPLVLALLLAADPAPVAADAPAAASRDRQLARVQLHRSGNRGQAYLPRARDDGRAEPAQFSLRPVAIVRVDGDPRDNVRSNLYPIDVDGDRRFELLQFNGYRFMRVYRQDGRKLWEERQDHGRVHRSHVHRDTLAVVDANGDGRQDILHCWTDRSGDKRLVLRRGDTGEVLRSITLASQKARTECQIAAFEVPGRAAPIVLVAHGARGCGRGGVDTFDRTVAFDAGLDRLWERDTCNAGHYAWPLDENGDGAAEGIFVGKHLLTPDGALRCTLSGWDGDHVDSMVVADLDPARSGLEVAAVGASGARIHDAGSCGLLARVEGVRNPQWVNAARLSPEADAPSIMMRSRNSGSLLYRVDARGRIAGGYRTAGTRLLVPTINANLDGAAAAEDMVMWFGQVVDGSGRLRLDTGWYWNLQPLRGKDRRLSPFEQWTSAPVVLDLDGDGRDELITWGRYAIVVGARAG